MYYTCEKTVIINGKEFEIYSDGKYWFSSDFHEGLSSESEMIDYITERENALYHYQELQKTIDFFDEQGKIVNDPCNLIDVATIHFKRNIDAKKEIDFMKHFDYIAIKDTHNYYIIDIIVSLLYNIRYINNDTWYFDENNGNWIEIPAYAIKSIKSIFR